MLGEKILILGYFGYVSNQLDGQTIKTRDVKELLDLKLGMENVKYFDTESLKYNKFNYFKLLFLLLTCSHLVYLPGRNNLLGLRHLISALIKIKDLNVYYLVIGGWLSSFLKDNPNFVSYLSKFKYIGVESKILARDLHEHFNFSKVDFFPNFRMHEYNHNISDSVLPLKLVFMARVMLEKGIDYLFDLAGYVDEHGLDITITFYGPIVDKDRDYFFNRLKLYSSVEYKGSLDPSDIHTTLSNYDALVLLTRFKQEGFPGSVLDAYISGIPVLVSDWDYSSDFVDDGITGFISNDYEQFVDQVNILYGNSKLLSGMKNNAYERSKLYSSDSAWKRLKKVIYE